MKTTQKEAIIAVLVIVIILAGVSVYELGKNSQSPTGVSQSPTISNIVSTGSQAQTPPLNDQSSAATGVAGMQEFTDTSFGFSFWYPSGWQMTTTAEDNTTKYPGGTVVKEVSITNEASTITLEEFVSPVFSITDSTGVGACPVCSTTNYYFDTNNDTWMVVYPDGASSGNPAPGVSIPANVSFNTMGGLHMLAGSQRFGANVIIPLSAENFVVVTVDGAIAVESNDPQALAKTILALNPKVATPVGATEQTQTIQAEQAAYSGLGGWNSQSTPQNPSSAATLAPTQISAWSTYDNFGISFQYPPAWGIPTDTLFNGNLESVDFENSSTSQPLMAWTGQDTNPLGTGVMNETFDQMIARFRTNDQNIYDTKDVSVAGPAGTIQGIELFDKNAVTGEPYHVDAYFPLDWPAYISIGADYSVVPLNTFDTILSTLKLIPLPASLPLDQATGMAVYNNNGMRFEYPPKFDTDYADLTIKVSVEKEDASKLDSNGCYPGMNDSGRSGPTSLVNFNGVQFCYTTGGGVGAGQSYTDYSYTTFLNGNAYIIDYSVHTSNGCGVYDPSSEQYAQCEAFGKNYDSIVTAPIQKSIATFTFTN